ncbi:succinate dehydrogenase, cytochrome b556 subunit [Alteromonas sp. ASW11-130]|uniref:succinate dehydrogenase, cytochrome b556 subunit n=1 Tax=Alteromonas sp. ASW11-130 TaxID=3015775 RepID=UPI002242A803|nr:succinate dehydrogenase, cytochrome b556 subunit [Alteromonas sp. ASW11-130]
MKKQRPVNLDLSTIKFPPAAISSILHRITGVALFFALLFLIGAWAVSLSSPEGFADAQTALTGIWGKLIAIGTLSALTYHLLGGIRHVVMEAGYWEEIHSGNLSAKIIMVLWVILTVVWGIALW